MDNDSQVAAGDEDGDANGEEMVEKLDELVLTTDPDAALKILRKHASWKERRALGNAKFTYRTSVLRSDSQYMVKCYRLKHDAALRSTAREEDEEAQKSFKLAGKNFVPLYFTTRPQVFRLRPHARAALIYLPHRRSRPALARTPVFQRIFLDKGDSWHLWSKDEVDPRELPFNNNAEAKRLFALCLDAIYELRVILRYLDAAAVLARRSPSSTATPAAPTSTRVKHAYKEIVKAIQTEYRCTEPLTYFLNFLYADFDFEAAERGLASASAVVQDDFFLGEFKDEFVEAARGLVSEVYVRIHQRIDTGDLSKRLNLGPGEGEKWIVNLTRMGTDAKIDLEKNVIEINRPLLPVYRSVIEKTRGLAFRTQAMGAAMARPPQSQQQQAPTTAPSVPGESGLFWRGRKGGVVSKALLYVYSWCAADVDVMCFERTTKDQAK
ncbi:hypothetical protein FIBSPDRAFT_1037899 [Athelia psychrophila]|uniref:PCI domain-containing protein n=1 Tax=Athelia psychrophila TaxID=1759441 RepID=A0A166TW20_9AGAM|nr:hypothetical protein FIBSPDRAFT_1037899 [Fibularhizoctonia sp. CBS 109695]